MARFFFNLVIWQSRKNHQIKLLQFHPPLDSFTNETVYCVATTCKCRAVTECYDIETEQENSENIGCTCLVTLTKLVL